jgi:hypothetical protein
MILRGASAALASVLLVNSLITNNNNYFAASELVIPSARQVPIVTLNSADGKFGINNQSSSSSFHSKTAAWNLEGTVFFNGLPCNPKTTIKVPPCDGPYPNYEVIVYAVGGKDIVSKTRSDQNGTYTMLLKTGNYTIYTENNRFLVSNMKANNFDIKEGRITKLDLVIDTGRR